jgi:hypothetical protein
MRLVKNWNEWCQVFNRLEFWECEIHQVCHQHGIKIHQVKKTFPGTHAVFFINDDLVLKFFCPVQYNSWQVEKDIHQNFLSGNSLYPVILFEGKSLTGYDYLFFTKSPGLSLRELGVERLSRRSLAQLARVVVDLQSQTLNQSNHCLQCLVHYDLTRDHIFLDDNGSLSAIIDFGDAFIGHPADEFPALFVDGLNCNLTSIQEFIQRYNEYSHYYQYCEADFLDALVRHPFSQELEEILKDKNGQ